MTNLLPFSLPRWTLTLALCGAVAFAPVAQAVLDYPEKEPAAQEPPVLAELVQPAPASPRRLGCSTSLALNMLALALSAGSVFMVGYTYYNSRVTEANYSEVQANLSAELLKEKLSGTSRTMYLQFNAEVKTPAWEATPENRKRSVAQQREILEVLALVVCGKTEQPRPEQFFRFCGLPPFAIDELRDKGIFDGKQYWKITSLRKNAKGHMEFVLEAPPGFSE